jgi:hypothetical protein
VLPGVLCCAAGGPRTLWAPQRHHSGTKQNSGGAHPVFRGWGLMRASVARVWCPPGTYPMGLEGLDRRCVAGTGED